jgi:hypothetical protein
MTSFLRGALQGLLATSRVAGFPFRRSVIFSAPSSAPSRYTWQTQVLAHTSGLGATRRRLDRQREAYEKATDGISDNVGGDLCRFGTGERPHNYAIAGKYSIDKLVQRGAKF